MKHNKIFSGVVAGLLLGSAVIVPNAGGAQDAMLQGRGEWQITKLDQTRGATQPYCTMTQPFDGGIVVTLARNVSEENSIALDFSDDRLSPGASYNLKLETGGAVKRAFEVEPLSSKVLVARIGRDPDFVDSLNTSGLLRVSIDGKNYTFAMRNAAEGYAALQNCLARLKGEPRDLASTMLDTAPTSTPEKKSVQASSDSVQRRMASGEKTSSPEPGPDLSLEQAYEELRARVSDLRMQNQRLKQSLTEQAENYEQSMAGAQDSAQSSELQEKVRILELRNDKLRQNVETLNTRLEKYNRDASQIISSAADAQKIQEENKKLKRQLEEMRLKMEEIRAEKQQLAEEKRKLEQKLALAQKQNDEELSRTKKNLAELRARARNLEQQLVQTGERAESAEELETSLSKAVVRADRAETEAEQIKQELEKVRKELERARGDISALKKQAKMADTGGTSRRARQKIERQPPGLTERDTRNTRESFTAETLGSPMDITSGTMRADGSEGVEDLTERDTRLQRVQAENLAGNTAQDKSRVQDLQETNIALRDKVMAQQDQLDAMRRERRDLARKLERGQGNAPDQAESRRLENALSDLALLRQQNMRLERRIDDMRAQAGHSQAADSGSEKMLRNNERLRDRVAELEEQIRRLETREDMAQPRYQDLREKVATLREENKRLAMQVSSSGAAGAVKENGRPQSLTARLLEGSQDNQQVRRLMAENEALREELSLLEQQINDENKGKRAARDGQMVRQLQSELEKVRSENEKLRQQARQSRGSLTARLTQSDSTNRGSARHVATTGNQPDDRLSQRIQDLEQTNTKLQDRVARLQANLQKAQEKLSASGQDDANGSGTAGQTGSPQMAQEVAFLRQENKRLLKELAKAREDAEQAGQELARAEKGDRQEQMETAAMCRNLADRGLSAQQQKQLNEKIEKLKARNNSMSQELAGARTALETTRGKIQDIQKQDTQAGKRVGVLEDRLAAMQERNELLRTQLEDARAEVEEMELSRVDNNTDARMATKRYQEAKREIRRLGSRLSEQRAQCEREKAKIEEMLFDPNLSDSAQISFIQELEDKLERSREKIKELRMQLAAVDSSIQLQPPGNRGEIKDQVRSAPVGNVARNSLGQGRDMATRGADQEQNMRIPSQKPRRGSDQSDQMVSTQAPSGSMATGGDENMRNQARVNYNLPNASDMRTVLQTSGIKPENFQVIQSLTSQSRAAFRWQINGLYGSAIIRDVEQTPNFQRQITQYINKARSRCQGEFAALPNTDVKQSGPMLAGYELACIQGAQGSSASVLFSFRNGLYTVIAHEGPANAMDRAMDVRDSIAGNYKTTKTASRY